MVSIPACHAGDPGSIPGNGDFFSFFANCVELLFEHSFLHFLSSFPQIKIKIIQEPKKKLKLKRFLVEFQPFVGSVSLLIGVLLEF